MTNTHEIVMDVKNLCTYFTVSQGLLSGEKPFLRPLMT